MVESSPDAMTKEDFTSYKFKDKDDAKPWLDMIADAERVFQPWQDTCDQIDKEYASLEKLKTAGRKSQFQMFWANLETLLPSIYSRPPQPVVVPRFKDRKPLPRETSEVLERALVANAELDNAHRQYLKARDDLARSGRGVLWARYDLRGGKYEYACLEHLNRKDFVHEPARSWPEVGWVARRSFIGVDKGVKRFGKKFLKLALSDKKTDTPEEYTFDKKAEIWEIWHKALGVVCWVSPNFDQVLDIAEPHISFDGFFPCPEPAYGTREPDSLKPVPDYLYYKDQIEEINSLTSRIAALSDALRLRGFYASGVEDVSKALATSLKTTSDTAVLTPVTSMAAFGSGSLKDAIVWLPLDMIASTIKELVMLRRQLIEDVYEITGISDIMRGSTAASETATAQQLKSQYGSVRVRERQAEMVRLCRDGTALQGEIIAEVFDPQSIVMMTQAELPTAQDIAAQVEQAMQQVQQMPPEQQQQAAAQLQELQATVTIDQVIALLKDERLRPFILDIETDSTIQPDEDAEKQRRTEFTQVVGTLLQNALPLLQAAPEAAEFVGEILQFGTAPFRAGRGMEGAIDDLVEKIKERAAQPQDQGPDPETIKAESAKQLAELKASSTQHLAQLKQQGDQQKQQHDGQVRMMDMQAKTAQAEARQREIQLKGEIEVMKGQHQQQMLEMTERLKGMDIVIKQLDVRLKEMAVEEAEKRAKMPPPKPGGSNGGGQPHA